ncbi:hypothetical protein ACUXV3_15575 [Roseobacteraceae bacterium NS-SX3]
MTVASRLASPYFVKISVPYSLAEQERENPAMFGEFEHACLLKMALTCKRLGLSEAECLSAVKAQTHGFSAPFRIRQAVHTAFHPEHCPDLA